MRSDFHSRVDGKGPTVSLILSSKNKLSCGYTTVSWQSQGYYNYDDTAWLMSLDTFTKYPVKDYSNAVYHEKGRSISFGNRHLTVGYYSEPINGVNASDCNV